MGEAIFGLIGVVVGGSLTWAVEVWRARRSDRDEARVAARLVIDELRRIESLRIGSDEPQFQEQRALALKQDAWMKHRVALARELDDDGWAAVRQLYDALAMPPQSQGGEHYVDQRWGAAMEALNPLTSAKRRYWWQRLWMGIRRQTPED